MKKFLSAKIVLGLFCVPLLLFARKPQSDLLGICSISALQKEPYASWYAKNFTEYNSNEEILQGLRKMDLSRIKIKILFGTWCGDSRREVPHMIKVLKQMSFDEKNLELIGVDDSTETYKQSPQHQEAGLEIYRVPTFIIYEKEKEINRIVEFPVESLERDLLHILEKKKYIPNYFSYSYILQWLKDGLLSDENVSARGLAMQIQSFVQHESELNACGYVLMACQQLKEAIKIFRINANLFPESSNCFDSLGEAYAKMGQTEKAIQSYETAVKIDPENGHSKEELAKLRSR